MVTRPFFMTKSFVGSAGPPIFVRPKSPFMKISIITINYNNGEGLERTIQSVIDQDNSLSIEHLVIDGGSIDNSREIIDKYQTHIAYQCSEKDRGIYHAMNKGIAHATGEYLLFLNSGDFLEPDSIAKVVNQLSGEDIVYGDLYFQDLKGNRTPMLYPEKPTTEYLFEKSLGHPATFFRRNLFEKYAYNESLKIVSDWEFLFRKIVMERCSVKHIPIFISTFMTDGISCTMSELCQKERQETLYRLLSPAITEELRMLYALKKNHEPFSLLDSHPHTKRRVLKFMKLLFALHPKRRH